MKKIIALLLVLSVMLTCFAQGKPEANSGVYPSKKISFIVPYAAGDGLDTSTRALLENADFGVTTVVENIVGGSGTIGLQEAFARPADGYTVAILSNGPSIAQPLMNDTLTYKLDDWEILTFTTAPVLAVLGCNSNLGVNSSNLFDYLNSQESFTVGVPSMTGFGYVAAASMFYQMGIFDKVEWVGYDGAPALYQAYLSHEVDFVTFDDNFAAQYVNAGENVVVGVVMNDIRSQYFPNVPAAGELGVKGLGGNIGFKAAAVKKGTPAAVCQIIADKINAAVVTESYQAWCKRNYFGVVTPASVQSSAATSALLFSVRDVTKDTLTRVGIL